ncbi:tyrosine-type recombinase/integrase [Microbulbifer sp. SA54]|uniref:tyrosine-type recombinase/integrase n=1 Tax=Microbulbifer sp. SA54 TaxID=3401577 RepID=UPI003AAE0000
MNDENIEIKKIINEWIATRNEEDQDSPSDFDSNADTNEFETEDENESYTSSLRLSDHPMSEWDYIKVSPKSNLADSTWDFSDYPSAGNKPIRVHFNYSYKRGFNLAAPVHLLPLRLTQALLFYRIPHVNLSGQVNSYSTLLTDSKKIMRISAFSIEHRLFESENGVSINEISQHTIENYINDLDTACQRWEFGYMLRFWGEVSSQGLLPKELALTGNLISKERVRELRTEYDEQSNPFLPLPMDDYATIFNYCLDMIEKYSQDCLWLYETFKHSLVGAYSTPSKISNNFNSLSPSSIEGVATFKSFNPVLLPDGTPWWPLSTRQRISKHNQGEYICISHIAKVITSLTDACCLLILCVTGMRRSELVTLKSDCLTYENDPWITYTVFKTSQASQGDLKKIPIPNCAAKAIEILKIIGHESRTYGNHCYLLSKFYKSSFGNPASITSAERSCNRVAGSLGIDEKIHPHRFRKSLALYLIHQDPKNLDIIRNLFSHTSLRMTLKYILSLPGVHEEVKKTLVEENSEILATVLKAVLDNKIGGIGGMRILKTSEESPILRAKLQNDGKESLSQYIASFLDEGVKLLHRTNMAICLKTPGLASPTPCDPLEDEYQSKLHPNIFACDPFNCRFAVFVEDNIPALENEIIFHNNIINHHYCGNRQKSFSQERIKDAHKRLEEIIGDAANTFLKKVSNG